MILAHERATATGISEATPDAAVLVDLLEHDDPRVRREAVAALAR